MLRKDIEKIYTDVITDYISKGYRINTNTMNGSQGEIAKIDLTNGKEIIRVMLDSDYHWDDDFCFSYDSLVLTVGKNTNKINNSRHDIIWNQDLEIINQTIYYQIGKKENFYGTKQDALDAKKKHSERVKTRRRNTYDKVIYTDNKRKEIVLPFIKKQYKCKSATIKDIASVEKTFDSYSKKMCYYVKARGRFYKIGVKE